ncbi:glucose-6-phosphatase catalytic subunit 1 [Amyelois transitella]|uniref:glucose-6-phosphatase catalytic subunit 1 n=1 Tax=Amyelois transitella TaxID=680683 RepID=UPI00067CFBAE|nr:glucose-6-phosphatase catalytic subunit 1 [Amyelois transitella]
MEQLYALGVSCIEFIQNWFSEYDGYFETINNLSNPQYAHEILFPLMSIVDSVFAAQLLLCISFGSWLNAVMKWWLLEDRPYWWVRTTNFYTEAQRPRLMQTHQTCETGPGSPSGHSATIATLMLLVIMWLQHVMNDRKYYVSWWRYVVYPLTGAAILSVMFARMFVATHFPHQVVLGAFIGSFLAPALCIYVSDPYIWQYGFYTNYKVSKAIAWHVFSAVVMIAIGVLTYYSLKLCGLDPMWTVKLAFRWCEYPENIHVSTTPMFALVQSTASLCGWALCVTPAIAKYRHYTKNRSLLISSFCTIAIVYFIKQLQSNISKESAFHFYIANFVITAVTPALFLRLVPVVAMWPFSGKEKAE